jgi:hypothetical protein
VTDEPPEGYEPEAGPPFWEFRSWLKRLLSRWRGPRLTELSDIVAPDALPICRECVLPHEQVTQYCPNCGEPVGHYKALVYPDLIWIWGRAMWRLMGRRRVSPFVWAGMAVFALKHLGAGLVLIAEHWVDPPPGVSDQAWAEFTGTAGTAVIGAIQTVAAWRVLSVARKLWGSWRLAPGAQGEASPIELH